ncbi:AraC family transcriptional regulator [[Ruminococcus] torques]|nr:AraC family transcriptional regulator [[Ruminococcus] torques]
MYGIAPMNYLAQKRIFTSQELLTSTDLNQAAIAKQCGFSSSSYFSQCFRKICGMTPTAYRKQFIR